MAVYTINVGSTTFYVVQQATQSTECADQYSFKIYANDGDVINLSIATNNIVDYFFLHGVIQLSNNAINSYYLSNGVRTDFIDSTTVIFDTSLIVRFSLENSGRPGYYNNLTLTSSNSTTSQSLNNLVIRENDSAHCVPECGVTNNLGLFPPQLFNPSSGEVTSGTGDYTVTYLTDIGFISINGQVLDDSEYTILTDTVTLTPDNGFNDITDEILIFQNKQ